MTQTSNVFGPIFKDSGTVLFFGLVCFQTVVFPPRKAVSYIISLRRDGVESHRLEMLVLMDHNSRGGEGVSEVNREFPLSKQCAEQVLGGKQTRGRVGSHVGGVLMQGGGVRICQVYANHLPLRRRSSTWSC